MKRVVQPTEKVKQKREDICVKCNQFKFSRCMILRKNKGCSVCQQPWLSAYSSCPAGKWDRAKGSIELDDDAIEVIERESFGRVLELGTGNMNGTEAALKNADAVVTVEHIPWHFHDAIRQYENDNRVTVLRCRVREDTYNLPDDIGTFDTIIVDGPRGTSARDVTLGKVIPLLNKGGKILVDDAIRDREIIDKWSKKCRLKVEFLSTEKGMGVMTHD